MFKYIVLSMLFCVTTLVAQQSGGYPENYFEILKKDISKVPNKIISRNEVSTGVASMDISGVNKDSFPTVKLFTTIKDSSGKHIPGLSAEDFTLYVKHAEDGSALGNKLSDLTVKEIGTVESKADIVFVIDSTGSMSGQIDTVKNNIIAFVNKLVDNNVSYRLAGFDYGDEVPYRTKIAFTDDADSFKSWVSTLSANGGDDFPENPLDAIISAGYLDYRTDAQQIIVLITDASAHVAGDGGDSKTTATFSSTAAAIGSKTFYYFSDDSSYSSLGNKLGGTYFDADTLIDTLSSGITGKYIVSFKDPTNLKDGRTRKVRLIHNESGKVATVTYKADEQKVTLSGSVTNNDDTPSPLKNVRIKFVNKSTSKTISTVTNTEGKYNIQVPLGSYKISASLMEYKTSELDIKVDEESSSVETIALARASIAEEKAELIAKAKKIKAFGTTFSSPYADEADAVINWASSLPTKADGDDNDPTDAEKEGLKRLIQASVVLDQTNGYVTKDASKLGESVGEVIVGILTLTGTFDKLQTQIRSIVSKIPDSDSWWYGWAIKSIKKTFTFAATKIGELSNSIANMILDFISLAYPENDYPIVGNIITVTKDVISASDGKPGSISFVTKKITPWVSKQVIIPFYTTKMESTWSSALNKSQHISSANFATMAANINESINRLNGISANFAQLEKEYSGLGTLKAYLSNIKNVLDVIHKLDPVVNIAEKVGVTAPYAEAIDKSLTAMDKALEAGNVIVSGSTAVISGNNLYGMSDASIAAMSSAYGLTILPVSTRSMLLSNRNIINNNAWEEYNSNKVKSISRSSVCGSGDAVEEFTSLIKNAIDTDLDANNSIKDFSNMYVDKIGKSFDCVTAEFDTLKAKIDAGSDIAYGKPVNYDLLSKTAYEEYMNLQKLSLSSMLKITSIMLNATMNATEDGKFNVADTSLKEELKVLLTEWSDSVTRTSDALAGAVNPILSYITSKPIVTIQDVSANIKTITEKSGTFIISATAKNISSVDATNVTIGISMPKKLDIEAMSRGAVISHVIRRSDILSTTDVNKTIETLAAGATADINWSISIDPAANINRKSFTFMIAGKSSSSTISGSKIFVLPAQSTDSDADGIPDFWETKYGLNPNDANDALLDSDGDRLNNITEYRYGFNPTDATSNDLDAYLSISSDDGSLKGDINGDKSIDNVDKENVVKLWNKKYGDASYTSKADINGNGYIDIEDIMLINAYAK